MSICRPLGRALPPSAALSIRPIARLPKRCGPERPPANGRPPARLAILHDVTLVPYQRDDVKSKYPIWLYRPRQNACRRNLMGRRAYRIGVSIIPGRSEERRVGKEWVSTCKN